MEEIAQVVKALEGHPESFDFAQDMLHVVQSKDALRLRASP